MRTSAVILLGSVLVAACKDSAGPPTARPASFAAVDGIGQSDTVGRELKDMIALRVVATDGASSVPNYPINWTALDGGQVFAAVAYSGTDGIARQRWTLGSAAGVQRLVARALDPETGAVLVHDTVTATGTPDKPTRWYWQGTGPRGDEGAIGEPMDLRAYVRDVADQWANPIDKSEVIGIAAVHWRFYGPTQFGFECLTGPSAGPEGSGWDVSLPDFVALGYRLFYDPVLVDTDGDGVEEKYALWHVNADIELSSPGVTMGGSISSLLQPVARIPWVDDVPQQPLPARCTS